MSNAAAYLFSFLFYAVIAVAGSRFTAAGVTEWYPALATPSFTPPGRLIGIIWTIIYILAAISLAQYMIRAKGRPFFTAVFGLYAANGILNAAWSYLFFVLHMTGIAVVDAALIGITVMLMIILARRDSPVSSLLLVPYFLWVCFATFLSYAIYRIN